MKGSVCVYVDGEKLNVKSKVFSNKRHKQVQKSFEVEVLNYLKLKQVADLWITGEFYSLCCEVLDIDPNKDSSVTKIRRRLNLMVKNNLIFKQRGGTGFLGKTDFGTTSLNFYTDKDYNK